MTVAELAQAMPDVARHFWGEPNPRHSSKKELRWGTNGARSVDVGKGSWFDHEAGEGGGVIDFLKREGVGRSADGSAARLRQHQQRPRKFQLKIVASLRLHRRIRHAAVPGLPPRAEILPPTAPGTTGRSTDKVKDGWVWSVKGVRQVPFRLPELIEALALEHRRVRRRGREGRSHARPPRHPGDLQRRWRRTSGTRPLPSTWPAPM